MDRSEGYDPANLREEGTLRARVLFTLLERHGVPLTRGRLLDLGCGYGGLSMYAAQNGATVSAVDVNRPALEILMQRLRRAETATATRVAPLRAQATHLPFESGRFDQAVTLGVLEWVPLASSGEDPRAVQVRAMREVCRTLAPGGVYVLGTKNRWHPKYAWHEAQVRWPLVNHLPRRLATLYSRAVYGREYRTYIHSLAGWQDMLEHAGFHSVRAFLPLFHYQFPLDLWPVSGGQHDLARSLAEAAAWISPDYINAVGPSRGPMKRYLLPLSLRLGLGHHWWPAIVFVAWR